LVLTYLSKTFLLRALNNGTGSTGEVSIKFCWMSWGISYDAKLCRWHAFHVHFQCIRSRITAATVTVTSFRSGVTTFSVAFMFKVCMQVTCHLCYGVMCQISGHQQYVGNVLSPCNTENRAVCSSEVFICMHQNITGSLTHDTTM
jgi:hypothetical protein